MENNLEVKYAGFWVRVLASVIDALILSLPIKLIDSLFGSDSWVTIILMLLIFWGYSSYCVYRWRGTAGKKILGLEVLGKDLEPVNLQRASVRFAYSLITYTILFSPKLLILLFSMAFEPLGYLAFVVVLLPILMMLFNDKKQVLHDYLAKTVVVDVEDRREDTSRGTQIEEVNARNNNTKKFNIIGFIRTIGIVIVVGFGAYYLYVFSVTAFVFGSLAKTKQKSYDNSFHIKYQTSDYNNSKIIFYKKELEASSQDFIDANDMYEIFESDVKKDLALGCIQYFIKIKNRDDWIEEGSRFRKNARNKYANTEEKIKKAKNNSNYMGKNFYTFDLNMVNHIIDDITETWSDKNESICEQKVPIKDMYKIFVKKYIPKFENENIYSRFGDKPQQRETDWHNLLMKSNPEYFKNKKEEEKILNNKYQKIKIEERKEKKLEEEKLYKQELKVSKYPIFVAIKFNKNSQFDDLMIPGRDLEMKNAQGHTLLRVAMQYKNEYALNRLLQSGANMYVMDKHNSYFDFTWTVSGNDLKTVKIFLNNGVDVNFQYKKSETPLTIAAKGCNNFELVKLLLHHGAKSDIIDTYGHTTISGLSRYCRDKEKYKKMKKLLEKKNSFFGW